MLKLRKWQSEFIAWYSKNCDQRPSVYLHGDLGTGKTIGALALLAKLDLKPDNFFILAPLSAHPSWQNDAKHFNIEIKPNKNLFTYEKFVRLTKIPVVKFIVCDEAHRLKNVEAKITKRLWKYYRDIPKLLMSGTMADREYELFSQFRLIDKKLFGDLSWTKFKRKYFFVDSYGRPTALLSKEARNEIIETIQPYIYRVSLDDVEMPELACLYTKLPPSKKIIEKWRDFESEIENPIASFTREYAIAQGIDPETGELFDKTKIDWVLDFLQDNPKTIVFSYFRAPVLEIKKRLGDKFFYVLGDYKNDVESILTAGNRPVIATYAIAEGINLQHNYNTLLYMSLPLAYRSYYQSRGRVYRSGQKYKVVAQHILMQPIDYEVKRIIDKKEELAEYLRHRPVAGYK